ncbi:MAG: BsaWI family type II restriction enzyme [Planctomycetaceae bacterium]|jgi:type II restriction enzyme|nr:BsaWI family type II restriction enzyme [Planctomycetaceae bacterium]
MYKLTKAEQKIMDGIKKTPYMKKTIELIEIFVQKSKLKQQDAYKKVFDEINRILYEAQKHVNKLLASRKAKGEIRDEKQAMKSIAGNSFSQTVIYIFLKNKELENIDANIFITSKPATVPSFDKISVINVDGETQKPDCDLVIYSLNEDNSLKKCMILSLKTSLRERAGQTYKWKLLMEIATSENSDIKEKYNISYNPPTNPLVCFATVNFYNEINNPQHRGMFKFFDQSFIAKNVDAEFIARMSNLPEYVNEILL